MRRAMVLIVAGMVVLLVASGLVSAGTKRPLANSTVTVPAWVFLPHIQRNETPTPTQEPVESDLKIFWINRYGSDEDIYISNDAEEPQDMTGWRLHSVVGDQWYDFPAGELVWTGVYVHSGPDADCSGIIPGSTHYIPPSCLVWTLEYIWDDYGDRAVLYGAAGQVVDEYCYGTGCP